MIQDANEAFNKAEKNTCYVFYQHTDETFIIENLTTITADDLLDETGLEQKGFIERKIPANNERQKNMYVLPKAIELIGAFNDSFQKVEDEIVQALSEEEKQILKEMLIKINERL